MSAKSSLSYRSFHTTPRQLEDAAAATVDVADAAEGEDTMKQPACLYSFTVLDQRMSQEEHRLGSSKYIEDFHLMAT